MTDMWDKLTVALNQILEIYQALLQLSQKKKEILIAAKPQELEKVTKQEEMLIIQAGKLEKVRLTVMQELVTELGISSEQAVLSELIKYADSTTAVKLNEIFQAFTEITGELNNLNELNEKLIRQSLEFVNYNINILSQSKADTTYAPQGQDSTGKPGRTILDAKA